MRTRLIAPLLVLAAAAARSAALAAPAPPSSATAPPRSETAEAIERRRAAIARELAPLGAAIRREIERGDAAALLARVPDDGLRCGGRVVPKARVARDLRSERSWLHGVFFGGPGYRPAAGTPASLRELLKAAREVAIAVTFEPDPRAGPPGRPCLDFRAKGVVTPGAPLCFERRGERWWLTESLYPCG
jgi:hypothetical protein